MANLNSYQVHTLTLAAGEYVQLDVYGEYVGCIKSDAAIKVGVDHNTPQPIEQGLTFRTVEGDTFKTIQIKNTSASSNVIELAIGSGQITDSRLSLTSSININGIADPVTVANIVAPIDVQGVADPIDLSVATVMTEEGDTTLSNNATKTILPSAGQRELLIQALPTNTGPIRVGSTTTINKGIRIEPGETLLLTINATVILKNNSGSNQAYNYTKII